MNRLLPRFAPALIALAAVAAPAAAAAQDRAAKGEAELAEILEGRVAGEPVNCIRDHSSQAMQVVDGTAFVFGRGDTIYVNRPDGAAMLDDWDLPVFEKRGGSNLCRQDRVELRQRSTLLPGPSLFLAEFVPYTRSTR